MIYWTTWFLRLYVDPACYSIFLDTSGKAPIVEFHRVSYPAEVTRAKIHANAQLADRLGDRLIAGE